MGLDPSSPIAPARVRALVLPVGKIKRSKFASFTQRLLPENVVRLGDISPDGRPNRNMFSPLGFSDGRIIYDLSTSLPPPSHLALAPFEQYREPLSVIAIADGGELAHNFEEPSKAGDSTRLASLQRFIRALDQELEGIRDLYPKALVHHLLIFDYIEVPDTKLPEGLFGIPPQASCKTTTIKTVMCDISSMLLAEMTTLARSLQSKHTIDSPNQNRPDHDVAAHHFGNSAHRRNSTFGNLELAETNGTSDKRANRMTMPASLTRRASNTSTSRPSTPVRLDDLASQKSPERSDLDRSASTNRGRISVQGFGSSVTNDIARNKGKARIAVVIGSLYLQAGRWSDSIKELGDAATAAKSSGDHLWHAKALDLIAVNLIMLIWANIGFRIPPICYGAAEKSDSKAATSNNEKSAQADASSAFAGILPELLTRILHLYERSSNRVGESLPQLAYSQSAVRFSKILTVLYMGDGKLSENVLKCLVHGRASINVADGPQSQALFKSSRAEVMALLLRALPLTSVNDDLSVTDRSIILAGIASILGDLGYHRKKAMVVRDLISAVIPGLIQARIAGAAEMGIHPSAGAVTLSKIDDMALGRASSEVRAENTESGLSSWLSFLGSIYGAIGFETYRSSHGSHETMRDDTDIAIISRIMRNARERVFGSRHMKMSVLRTTIDLLEALPDHVAVLRCTSDLLRTAGSGIAPGPRSLNASPTMSREEQLRLLSTMHKHVTAGRRLGLPDLCAEYWDEFLLRSIDLESPPHAKALMPQQTSLLGVASGGGEKPSTPFIHNPYAKRNDVAVERVLVAGESATFKINLQNPYDVDLEIESVRLESSSADFKSFVQRTVIGPYRTQVLSIGGIPKSAGEVTITGCIIQVKGCRERRFPIFEEPWGPNRHIKIKSIGIDAVEDETVNKYPENVPVRASLPELTPPKTTTLNVMVVESQPLVSVKSVSISQSAIMILEGERQQFTVTLQNLSPTTPVDLILFSFQDSTQAALQAALNDKDASPLELYEYELISQQKQALRHVANESPMYIGPDSSATFIFELLGKPGLTDCTIQVDYCNLRAPSSDIKDKFYTRQITIPLTVTVNSSVELSRVDILPLRGKIPDHLLSNVQAISNDNSLTSINDHCFLILDLRNAWPSPLHIDVISTRPEHSTYAISESVLPGSTTRLLLPIPRVYLDDPHKAIPSLNPSRQRQFVVSTQNVQSVHSQSAIREAFWYREAILSGLAINWTAKSEGPASERRGVADLRSMRLNRAMIDILKVEEVGIDICLGNNAVTRLDKNKVPVDTFQDLLITLTNRTSRAISRCVVRIHAAIHNLMNYSNLSSHNLRTPPHAELDRKLLFQGNTQFSVEGIEAYGSIEFRVGFLPMTRGEFVFSCVLEEIEIAPKDPKLGKEDEIGAVSLEQTGRRRWISREGFVLSVVDEVDQGP